MTFNTGTGFTDILTDSGTAVIDAAKPNLEIVGSGSVSTSAAGNVITIAGTGGNQFIQQVRTRNNTATSLTGVIPTDDTIPQQTEGTEFITLAITPTNASNILMIEFDALVQALVSNDCNFALFQDATASAVSARQTSEGIGEPAVFYMKHYMVAGTTSSTTFKIRGGPPTTGGGQAVTVNQNGGSRVFGGVSYANLIITEISV